MGKKLSELVAAAEVVLTDIFHLRTAGGIDKKITGTLLYALLKGFLAVQLTNYTGVGLPAIVANSIVEIDGEFYTNPIEVAIGGATANTTWYDILLTPSGSTFTASFIARGTGAWSDAKQGLYDGVARVVACVYKIAAGNWIDKNILEVKNRTCKIKMEIGAWNMDTGISVFVNHGLSGMMIVSVLCTIVNDDNDKRYFTPGAMIDVGAPAVNLWIQYWTATQIGVVRLTNGFFDTAFFDHATMNRGWLFVDYEV